MPNPSWYSQYQVHPDINFIYERYQPVNNADSGMEIQINVRTFTRLIAFSPVGDE